MFFVPSNECITFMEAAYTQKLTAHIITTPAVGKKFVGPLTSHQSGPALATTAEGGNLQCVGVPAANGDVGGVASWDCAVGSKVPIIRGAGTMLPVMSGAAVTIGDRLKVDSTGRVVPWSGAGSYVVGKAHSTVAGADLEVIVELAAIPATPTAT